MKVSDLGELGLVEMVRGLLPPGDLDLSRPDVSPRAGKAGELLLGAGDDAAAWWIDGRLQIATTDTMIEGVHFRREMISAEDLGWKSLAISLSDIAAMGGTPRYALLNLGLRPETEVPFVASLYEGLLAAANQFGLALAGGDTVSSPVMVLATTVLGDAFEVLPRASGLAGGAESDVPTFRLLTRSTAVPGDVIAVTGQLGASAAGLRMLLSGDHFSGELTEALRRAHVRPVPRLHAGRYAVERGLVAGMDISDGLLIDLGRLATASGVEARIWSERVPVGDAARAAYPADSLELALAGGEDYELILVGPSEIVAEVQAGAALPVTVIGEILSGQPGTVRVLDEQGREVSRARKGWDHFRGQLWANDPSR